MVVQRKMCYFLIQQIQISKQQQTENQVTTDLEVVEERWSMLTDRRKASLWAMRADLGEALGLVSESALSSSPMALM